MRSYLVYQKQDKIDKILIPKGFEKHLEDVVAQHKGVKISKLGINLTDEEIVGVYPSDQVSNLEGLLKPPPSGPGYKTFLQFGEELKARKSLDKWKAK